MSQPSNAPDAPAGDPAGAPSQDRQAGYPASLWRRLGALLYDWLLIVAIWMLSLLLWVVATGEAITGLPVQIVALIEFAGFYALFWRTRGQTLGMRSWRLWLVSENGAAPSWRQIVARLAVAPISLACGGLGYLWLYVGDRQQTWHDRASRTYVVHVPKR